MNILNRGQFSNYGTGLRERISAGDDYRKNSNDLRIIQAAVVTVVMVS